MSTQVSTTTFRAYLGNEELLRDRQNVQTRIKQNNEKSRKVVIESSHNKYFTDGVRAPLLSDITYGQSCRLDVVRTTKLVNSTGSSCPESPGRKNVITQTLFEKESSNVSFSEKTGNSLKSIKFLLPNGTLRSYKEPEMTRRSASDLDVKWKRSQSQIADARDVLYRNTYSDSNKRLRYHTMSLPSIASQNKAVPRIHKNKLTTKKKIHFKDVERPQTKLKDSGETEIKTNNKKNSAGEEGFLKVQKIKSNLEYLPNGCENIFLTVRQPTDLYSHSSYPVELRTERPMKYETVGPHGSRLNRKHSTFKNTLQYLTRDYKSAEAYKEYLAALKTKMELDNEQSSNLDNDLKELHYGRENRMLQSVIDVNTPRYGPLSHDSKSLVIEIKPTWNEKNGMGVKIYVWLPANGNVGHASMTLSDGTHISWWPAEEKSKASAMRQLTSVEAGTAKSYKEDTELEGKAADYIYDIPSGKLDEKAIRSWWSQFSNKGKYHLLANNCCSAVYQALNNGGAQKYASFPLELLSTPSNVKEYAEKLKKATY